ncbi:metabolite traffic protein EboE [Massilia sp. W12]|uniref:metabolite traffic protein EboE n=1 Tax=Massilia sp. W12 TaxID=3126507 RepID=UPI0030CBB86F
MKLSMLPGKPHLGYCSNIHAGETLAEIEAGLRQHLPLLRQHLQASGVLAPRAPLGLGLRLSAQAAAALQASVTLQEFAALLDNLGAYVFSINAFPYGEFHRKPVKQQVYEPDWSSSQRVRYSSDCARVLASLSPLGEAGSISTVPLGWRNASPDHERIAAMLPQLQAAVLALVQVEREAGQRICLALEPEPGCLLENGADALDFFRQYWLAASNLRQLAQLLHCNINQAERIARRHLGLCFDVCHSAVEFEEPRQILQQAQDLGVSVAKIQLSNALRIPAMHAQLAPQLQGFDDGVYLHQVVRRQHASLLRDNDLPQALASASAEWPQQEWRIHCHVPLFWEGEAQIGPTRQELRQTLSLLREQAISPHLEIETYTWDVLPPALRGMHKAEAIAREFEYVYRELQS